MAHKGERVVISSRSGYAELTPVSKEDKEVGEYVNSKPFMAVAKQVRKEYKEGKGVTKKLVEVVKAHYRSRHY